MVLKQIKLIFIILTPGVGLFPGSAVQADNSGSASDIYDASAYTEYVESKLTKLDKIYLQICSTCKHDSNFGQAKIEFFTTMGELMKHMNKKFDTLDPKTGAALSPTETLVTIHVLAMLADILAQYHLQELKGPAVY